MFGTLLVLSLALLLIAVAIYRWHPMAILGTVGLFAFFSYGFLSFSTRSLLVIFPCLLVAWALCRWRNATRKQFVAFASLSIAAGWGAAMVWFIPRWNEIQQLAVDYPVEQVGERLAYERSLPQGNRDTTSEPEFMAFPSEGDLNDASGDHGWYDHERNGSLAALERTHDDFVEAFVSQEGFGFVRMRFRPPRDHYIRLPEREAVALAPPPRATESAGVTDDATPVADQEPFRDFHQSQAIDFLNPKAFGYSVPSENPFDSQTEANQVRGFQPHAFSTIPTDSPAGDEWQLARLELVSLLKHDPPAVYVSDHLPRMQELSSDNAPTRPLNAFETTAMQRLRDGETIIAEESRNRITMLGGLRAARQCLQCHNIGEGHLLGAFTYEFLRKQPLPPKNEKPKPAKPVT